MKISNYFFLILIFTLISCKEYKALMSERTFYNCNQKLFFKDSTMKTFEVNLNGIKHCLLFDTGAGATLINNPKFNIEENKKIRERKIYGFEGKSSITSTHYTLDSLNYGFINSNNKSIYLSIHDSKVSCNKANCDGILGNFFNDIDEDKEIELNFSEGFIRINDDKIDKNQYYSYDIQWSSNSGKVYVKLEFDGISDFFLFDTGNYTSIILNNDIFKNTKNKVAEFSVLLKTIANAEVKNFSIYDAKFKLANNILIDQYIAKDTNSKRSTLSYNFIRKFNWVIDRKNNKIYCMPISEKKLNTKYILPKKTKSVGIINDKLYVVFSLANELKFKCGDEITTINEVEINANNICEMQTLLNNTENWEPLKLEVIPAKKE